MQYKENIGTISRIFRPSDGLMWSVPNMFDTYNDKNVTCVASPLFSFLDNPWRLVLKHQRGTFGLFLWKLNPPRRHRYRVKLAIKFSDGPQYDVVRTGELDSWGHFGFVRSGSSSSWDSSLPSKGFVVIFCEIEEEDVTESVPILGVEDSKNEEVKNEDDVEVNVSEASGTERLVQDLQNLFLSEQSKDVVLKTDGREFAAHRAILGARSPVFASMFQHDMAEKTTGVVDVSDCQCDAFQVFLLHTYTGTASGLSDQNVFNVYYAADKYQVNDLKEDCVKFMEDNLSVDTFCDVIALSLRHRESELKETAISFFCSHVKKIVKTVQWQKYVQDNPVQANELYIKAIDA